MLAIIFKGVWKTLLASAFVVFWFVVLYYMLSNRYGGYILSAMFLAFAVGLTFWQFVKEDVREYRRNKETK